MGLLNLFKRQERPAPVPQRRSFDGAAGGRRASGFGTFHRINPEVAAAGASLRSRARHLAHNNPWIANAVENWVGELSGSGIMPTSRHPERENRRELNGLFQNWTESADADGRTNFEGLQAALVRALVVDGEAFFQVLRTDVGPRMRHLPAELIDESMTRELPDGGIIVAGVEFNGAGERVAYHVLPDRPHSQFTSWAPPIRVAASEILHVMRPLAAGQVRGITWLAPAILPANELDQLSDALLVGNKIAAMHAGFLVDLNGTGDPYDGAEAGGIMETGIEPGTLKRLPSGIDVKFNTPGQVQQVDAFLKMNRLQLAAALGVPTHFLDGDLSGANYSSLRAGLLPFRRRVEQIQYGTLVPQFLAPIWRDVIAWHVLSGALEAPDFESSPRAYGAEWLPPKPLQVDPEKDVRATVAELEAGLTSRRKAVAERGWAIEDLDEEIAAEGSSNAADSES